MRKVNPKLVLSRDEIKDKSSHVGQAAFDIMSKSQSPQEVGETMAAMTPKYFEELESTILNNQKSDKPCDFPFYIVVLRKKEPYAVNVLRHWYVARQTRPDPRIMREDYGNFDLDLWEIRSTSDFSLLWVLPTRQDSYTILKNKHFYDPQLVEWITQFNQGTLR